MLNLIVLALVTVLASYLYWKLRYMRFSQYADIPQLPNHLVWGHLKIFEEMWMSLGRPPVMLVDLRPVNPPMLLVSTHDVAEHISKPSKLFPLSTTKSPTWTHMIPIIGKASILGREGSDWKDLRKKYNPGFSTQHLWRLLPLILEKMGPFCSFLDEYASSGEEFSLEKLISNLTFDVIGAVVMEVDLDAQQKDHMEQGELIRLFGQLVQTYRDDKNNLPWWIIPRTTLRRHRLASRVDVLIRRIIKQKYSQVKEEAESNRSWSILALSFEVLSETADQVRTFLFAGHDTNTSMLEWAIYELSRTPRVLKAVRDELDAILGPESDPQTVCNVLRDRGEQLLPKLSYINAIIKETLRLHPPASTARMAKFGSGFTVALPTGEEYLVDGTVMYPCASIIQRDPNVYGETANDWVPERWLGEAAGNIPSSAWRPFERGPRNCIGIELANHESRIILAIIARKYNFCKTGLGEPLLDEKGIPSLDGKGQFHAKSELYNTRRMTSQPIDGTVMRVKLA
ncbi:cytochrome P450 [Nemania diffusa]|nr:cytochrome P450 [Nemania diffusa]